VATLEILRGSLQTFLALVVVTGQSQCLMTCFDDHRSSADMNLICYITASWITFCEIKMASHFITIYYFILFKNEVRTKVHKKVKKGTIKSYNKHNSSMHLSTSKLDQTGKTALFTISNSAMTFAVLVTDCNWDDLTCCQIDVLLIFCKSFNTLLQINL